MFHFDARVTEFNGVGGCPGIGIEPLSLTAQFRKPRDRHINPHQCVPCGRTYDAIRCQIEDFLKLAHCRFCAAAENSIHNRDFRNGGVALTDAIERCLYGHHRWTRGTAAQRCTGVRSGDSLNGRVWNDFHIAVITAQDFGRVQPLLRQILTAPLAEPFAGDGGAVAELGCQWFHKSGAAQIIIKEFIHQPCDVIKIASSVDKILVKGGGIGNIKIIAAAAVEFRVHTVQGERCDRQNICPQGAFVPCGVNFTGCHIFDIV